MNIHNTSNIIHKSHTLTNLQNLTVTSNSSIISPTLSNIYLNNFKYLIHGGYANIYYNSKTLTILKVQPLYENTNYICSSTLYETMMFHTLLNIPNSCHIKDIKLDDTYAYHYMPYYGKPLHEFVNINIKKKANTNHILPIILSIIEKCILLYERGIQHTDLKPNNIIINELNTNVTLIDYNICSIRSSGKTKFGWSYGIGTWCYCSPEIIYYDEPSDTSMVWSIGVLLAYMYYGHPLTNKSKNIYDYVEQNDWKNIYNSLKVKYNSGLPLSKEHKSLMPTRVQYIYSGCTFWDWQKRPSLYELYELIFKILYNDISYTITHTKISYILNRNYIYKPGVQSIKVHNNIENRKSAFNTIWEICKLTKRFDILCRTLILIDKYPKEITKNDIIGCIYSSYILLGSLLSDNSFTSEIYKYFDITLVQANSIILNTLETLKWDCYFETADILIIEYILEYIQTKNKKLIKYTDKIHYIKSLYSQYSFYKILFNIIDSFESNTEYTMTSIVELLFKEIIAQNLIQL